MLRPGRNGTLLQRLTDTDGDHFPFNQNQSELSQISSSSLSTSASPSSPSSRTASRWQLAAGALPFFGSPEQRQIYHCTNNSHLGSNYNNPGPLHRSNSANSGDSINDNNQDESRHIPSNIQSLRSPLTRESSDALSSFVYAPRPSPPYAYHSFMPDDACDLNTFPVQNVPQETFSSLQSFPSVDSFTTTTSPNQMQHFPSSSFGETVTIDSRTNISARQLQELT